MVIIYQQHVIQSLQNIIKALILIQFDNVSLIRHDYGRPKFSETSHGMWFGPCPSGLIPSHRTNTQILKKNESLLLNKDKT